MNTVSALAYIIQPLIAITLLLNVAFLANYGLRSKWRQTAGGKLFFYVYCLITGLLALNGASYFFEDYPGRDGFRLFVYGGLLLNSVASNVVLLNKQRQEGHEVRDYIRGLDASFKLLSNREVDEIWSALTKQYQANPEKFKASLGGQTDNTTEETEEKNHG